MKNIIIPNKELQLLSGQLQNFKQGYTVSQIRSLDRVIQNFNTILEPFTSEFQKKLNIVVSQLSPKEQEESQAEKDKEINDFLNTEGNKEVVVVVQDEDLEFIKMIWSRLNTLNGLPEARQAIIKIDDALLNAKEPTFK